MRAPTVSVPKTLGSWRGQHRDHGRCGPFQDASIHLWKIHRCPCGSRFYVSEIEAPRGEDAPGEARA